MNTVLLALFSRPLPRKAFFKRKNGKKESTGSVSAEAPKGNGISAKGRGSEERANELCRSLLAGLKGSQTVRTQTSLPFLSVSIEKNKLVSPETLPLAIAAEILR
ncbi:MAG: hypothetical protein JSU01_19755 [Bacteroidetes bacterium]|nr:hypothetical protein [Bacteroidota bacterium]